MNLALDKRNQVEDRMTDFVGAAAQNVELFQDYSQRPTVVSRMRDKVNEFNAAANDLEMVRINSVYLAPWIANLCVALYVPLQAPAVFDGRLSLGFFLTNLKMIRTLGMVLSSIYNTLLDMQSTIPALQNIVKLLNLPIEGPALMHLTRHLDKESLEMRRDLLAANSCAKSVLDNLPFKVENIQYRYSTEIDSRSLRSNAITICGSLSFEQGQLIALVGHHGDAKTTLLNIIGRKYTPDLSLPNANFFFPSHLRVVLVSQEPVFLNDSLMANLTIGVDPGHRSSTMSRVHTICRRLGVPDEILEFLDSEHKFHWKSIVSTGEAHRLALARALIANPEVLCLHKPTHTFNKDGATTVLELLKEFVTQRGVDLDPDELSKRRPRTCIFTNCDRLGIQYADKIVLVRKGANVKGMEEISKDDDLHMEMIA